jgi:hypothetical protein
VSLTARVLDLLQKSRRTPSPRVRVLAGLASALLFGAMAVLAARSFPWDERDVRWAWLVPVAVIGVPLNLLTSIWEFGIQKRLLGQQPDGWADFRTVVAARAANLLPLPGSVVVRTTSLVRAGGRVGLAALSNLVVALAWLGVTLLLAGIALATSERWAYGLVAAAVGVPLVLAAVVLLRRPDFGLAHPSATAGRLLVVHSVGTIVTGARFWWAAQALDAGGDFAQVVPLASAGALASAVGFFPAGLGVREALAGLAAATSGLGASVGVLVALLDRLVGLVAIAVFSAIAAVGRGTRGGDADQASSAAQ